jgi:hypothetical protein
VIAAEICSPVAKEKGEPASPVAGFVTTYLLMSTPMWSLVAHPCYRVDWALLQRNLNHYSAVLISTAKDSLGTNSGLHKARVEPEFPPHKNNHGRTNRAGYIVALGTPLHNPRTHVLPDCV